MLTDKLFTGQREMADLGIYHYGARFYEPTLGRFLSPDTIIPSYANPQSLNRFSYVTNNPLRYTDPSGHRQCEEHAGTCLSEKQETKKNEADRKKRRERAERANKLLNPTETLLPYDPDAILWGVAVSGSEPGLYSTGGLEEIAMFSNKVRATYSYGGQGSSVGAGASAAVYGGIVFNLKDPDDYKGPFGSAGVTVSILDFGVTASYFLG